MAQPRDDDANTRAFLASQPEIRVVDLLLADLCGILRGKRVTVGDLAAIHDPGLYLPGSMFALDVLGGTVQATGLGFDEGDADRPCRPIPGTLYPAPWLGSEVAQWQLSMFEHDGRPFFGDPRHVLTSVLERYAGHGWTPVVALEFEFYFVDPARTAAGYAQPPPARLTGRREHRTQINSMADLDSVSGLLEEIAATCAAQGVPTAAALAEYGPSQWEVNLRHVPDALAACDQAIRFKRIVKGVALNHGVEATFMAKPYADMAGSGLHLHVSLLDTAGRNVFAAAEPCANPLLRQAAAGMLATMAEGMAVFAPNANSYRRLRPQAYVPLHATWGHNNRGVAVRVPVSDVANRRLEHRVAGADANPYLLAAVVLAGMLHGLERQLEPPAPFTGNAYTQVGAAPPLPTDWPTALARFGASAVLREYLGAKFVRLYETTRRGEMEDFAAQLTPLEFAWYLAAL
ncbi:MAG: glutamine synthetase [Gammaproteobacteria bacterium]|nr:glutamine synthetase [Gammaproteobacteria bacterium]